MKILFDQGVPKPLQAHLSGHEVRRTFQLGWADKKNGELLALAEEAGYEIFVTTDQNLLHQQNLRERKMAVFILGRGNWPEIKPHATRIAAEINAIKQPGITFLRLSRGVGNCRTGGCGLSISPVHLTFTDLPAAINGQPLPSRVRSACATKAI